MKKKMYKLDYKLLLIKLLVIATFIVYSIVVYKIGVIRQELKDRDVVNFYIDSYNKYAIEGNLK